MINYDYKYARDRIAKEKRAESRTFMAAGAILFVLYLIVSTMSYNDCLQGVC
jgi:hypothetical protein